MHKITSDTRHILIAEDDPRDEELAITALGDYFPASQVFVVHDGEETLDYLYRRGKFLTRPPGNPVAVLLDLKMPKLNGLEVVKIIKSDETLKMIPIVVLTSSSEASDVAECYRHGANAYVVKPMDFGEFTKAVSQLGVFWTEVNEPPPQGIKTEPSGESQKS